MRRDVDLHPTVALDLQLAGATVEARPRWLIGVTGAKSKFHAVEPGGPPEALCLRPVMAYDHVVPFELVKDKQICCERCVGIVEGHRRRPERDGMMIVQIR